MESQSIFKDHGALDLDLAALDVGCNTEYHTQRRSQSLHVC